MKAVAAQNITDSSALKKQKAEARTKSVSPISIQSLSAQTGAIIQRKCACGGDCPRCQEEPPPHRGHPLQAKLQVSQPGDVYEQEADRIAEYVMSAPQANRSSTLPHRTEPSSLRISRHPLSAATPASDAPNAVQEVLRSSGEPLDNSTRNFMESQFGHDFGHVRVHTGREAMESASSLSARAYTVGGHIVFGSGQYAPSSNAGRRLLAHELTHVVQQGAARGVGPASPSLTTRGPLIQRDEDPNMREAHAARRGAERIKGGIPLEKWSPDVERAYRRMGLTEEANGVMNCREWGACDKLITADEAYEAYRKGRSAAGLGAAQSAGAAAARGAAATTSQETSPVAVGGVVMGGTAAVAPGAAPLATGGGGGMTAAARGAARGLFSVPMPTTPVPTPVPTPSPIPAPTAAPAAGGATVATVAVPVALGIYLAFAIKDLINFGSFQAKLRELGYIILPSPLGVCIGLCHSGTPAPAPRFDMPQFVRPVRPFPMGPQDRLRPFPDDEADTLKDWLDPAGAARRTAPPATRPAPTPAPTPTPVPVPAPRPDEDDRRRPDCQLVPRTIGRGDDPLANLFCSVVSNDSPSYDIYSRVGRAEIDALRGRTWYECKCGQVSLVRAMKRGERWARSRFEGPTGMDEQIRRQSRVALHCRYNYQVVVASDYVANFFRERYGDIRVEVVNFDPCEK
jgi:hypothetical protein